MKIKICGITNEADARAAVDAGADALGFIVYPKSPRYIAPAQAAAIAAALPASIWKVAVQVGWTAAAIRAMEALFPFDVFQLHGAETPALCRDLAPRRLWKAFGLPRADDASVAAATEYTADIEAFLLDKADPRHGGTGEAFDWKLAIAFQQDCGRPCVLSGGLHPGNVREAIEAVRPWAVDVCSGVERSPGCKDHAKVRDFITQCRTCQP